MEIKPTCSSWCNLQIFATDFPEIAKIIFKKRFKNLKIVKKSFEDEDIRTIARRADFLGLHTIQSHQPAEMLHLEYLWRHREVFSLRKMVRIISKTNLESYDWDDLQKSSFSQMLRSFWQVIYQTVWRKFLKKIINKNYSIWAKPISVNKKSLIALNFKLTW